MPRSRLTPHITSATVLMDFSGVRLTNWMSFFKSHKIISLDGTSGRIKHWNTVQASLEPAKVLIDV